jgi:hypothetical protein
VGDGAERQAGEPEGENDGQADEDARADPSPPEAAEPGCQRSRLPDAEREHGDFGEERAEEEQARDASVVFDAIELGRGEVGARIEVGESKVRDLRAPEENARGDRARDPGKHGQTLR